MNHLKKFVRILRSNYYILINYVKNLISIGRLYLNSFHPISNKKILIVSIKNLHHGRYGFQLLNYFSKGGYDIVFYRSNSFLINLHGYDRLIYKLPNVSVYRKIKYKADLNVTKLRYNTNIIDEIKIPNCKEMYLNLNYFLANTVKNNTFKLPYYVHPLMNKFIDSSKKIIKQHKVLFYGQSDLSHNDLFLKEYFNMINRREVFKFIEAGDIPTIQPNNYEELNHFLFNPLYRNSFFFLDSKEIWIPAHKWIETLSSFDFFICTPGQHMPISHNIIEAISQGVIPILQYPNEFNPPLQNDLNCLTFNSLSELKKCIYKCINMTSQDIDRIRKNLFLYYQYHIVPENFFKKIDMCMLNHINIFLNAEELSLSFIK